MYGALFSMTISSTLVPMALSSSALMVLSEEFTQGFSLTLLIIQKSECSSFTPLSLLIFQKGPFSLYSREWAVSMP